MDKLYKVAKLNFTSTIFSEYNKMRENEFFCDFQIKVGNKSSPVHRSLLVAASKYFKAMFTSNMKEVEQGFIDMKDVDAEGVKYCLEFIYTREIDLSIAPVKLTLHASHLMQLDDLTDLCFGYLKLHITPESSISTLKLAQLHDRDELINIADQYITDHLEAVTLTGSFFDLDQADMLRHLNSYTVDHRVSWQAVMKWLSTRGEDSEQILLEIMKSYQIKKFPFKFLLETVLNEPLVQGSQTSRDLVINYLFANAKVLKENLSLQTFFNLRELAENNKIPNAAGFRILLDNFMEGNFEKLTQEDRFTDLEEKEILYLFQSQKTKYTSEKTKFDAALKWAETNQRNRKSFSKLFTCIKLDLISPEFIQQTVLNEPLVKESHACKDELLVYYTRGQTQQIACLDSETGDIKALNLSTKQWSDIAGVKKANNMRIVSIKNMLYLLNDKTVSVLLKDGTWMKKTDLPRVSMRVVHFKGCLYCIDYDFMSCYDPMQDTWNTNLPGCGLLGFCVAASNEYIYAMGGICARNAARHFDPKTGKWSKIASMNKSRYDASASVMNRTVFVMGGGNPLRLNSVECYNPVVGSWTEISSMCRLRVDFSSCVVNNKLYVVGGVCNANSERLNPDSIEVYDDETRNWRIVQKMKISQGNFHCCVFSP